MGHPPTGGAQIRRHCQVRVSCPQYSSHLLRLPGNFLSPSPPLPLVEISQHPPLCTWFNPRFIPPPHLTHIPFSSASPPTPPSLRPDASRSNIRTFPAPSVSSSPRRGAKLHAGRPDTDHRAAGTNHPAPQGQGSEPVMPETSAARGDLSASMWKLLGDPTGSEQRGVCKVNYVPASWPRKRRESRRAAWHLWSWHVQPWDLL